MENQQTGCAGLGKMGLGVDHFPLISKFVGERNWVIVFKSERLWRSRHCSQRKGVLDVQKVFDDHVFIENRQDTVDPYQSRTQDSLRLSDHLRTVTVIAGSMVSETTAAPRMPNRTMAPTPR